MKPYTLHLGSCHDVLDTLPENSVDSIVTDPPYEINFMAKTWDNAGVAFNPVTWGKALRVLKPGGHMLVFGHSRKMHRIIVAIEDAGFEIRDTLMWLYGSGFPKSLNISKSIESKIVNGSSNKKDFSKLNGERLKRGDWGIAKNSKEYGFRKKDYTTETTQTDRLGKLEPSTPQARQYEGWGTALKPAYEPIVLARKPFKGSVAKNVLEHGTGGINIDECRVGNEYIKKQASGKTSRAYQSEATTTAGGMSAGNIGRFPANVMHDGSEEVVSGFPNTSSGYMGPHHIRNTNGSPNGIYGKFDENYPLSETYGDSGNASRFFYCAKASKKDRDEGLFKDFETVNDGRKKDIDNAYQRGLTPRKNTHPTVKPTELMQYLVRLITPKGGTVLDPFMGSGSTGKATMIENNERNANYHFIGIDLEQEYIDIAKARIEYGVNYQEHKAKEKEAETVDENQTSIFDFLESQQNKS